MDFHTSDGNGGRKGEAVAFIQARNRRTCLGGRGKENNFQNVHSRNI